MNNSIENLKEINEEINNVANNKHEENNNTSTQSNTKPESFKEYLIYCSLEILKNIFTTHFWGTTIIICLFSIEYLAYLDKINLSILFSKLSFLSIQSSNIILILLCIIILGLTIFISNKIVALHNSFHLNNRISDILIKEYTVIREELGNFIKILASIQALCNDISKSTDNLFNLITQDQLDINAIYKELSSVVNVMNDIPSRDAILNLLVLRSQMIYVDIAEAIIEYISDHSTIKRIMTLDENSKGVIINTNYRNKNKNSYVDQKLIHKINDIKEKFVDDIYKYSKNTLDINIKDDIKKELDESLDSIINLLLNPEPDINLELEGFFYNMHHTIKNLSEKLLTIFSSNLILPSIFRNN